MPIAVAFLLHLFLLLVAGRAFPPGSSAGADCRSDAQDGDGASDYPDLVDLCDEPLYETTMREQCLCTCDYCDDLAYSDEEEASSSDESDENTKPVMVSHSVLPWSMNRSKSPCDDFYGYVCDGYIARAVIADDAYGKGSFSDAQDVVDQRLFELFSNRDIALSTVSDTFTPMIYPFFGACTNMAQRDQAGAKHIVQHLSQISKYSAVGELAEHLYSVGVSIDPRRSNESILELGGASPTFKDPNFYQDESPQRKAFLAHITRLLGYLRDDDPQRTVFPLPTSIDRIVRNFEVIDADIFANSPHGDESGGERKKPEKYDNPLAEATFLSLAEFKQRFQGSFDLPSINIPRILEQWLSPPEYNKLQSRFGADLARIQMVMDAESVVGTEKTMKKFSSTPQELEKLRDYAMVTSMRGWVMHLDSRFQDANEDLEQAMSLGKSKRLNMTKACKDMVVQYFPHLIDRLYIRRYFDEAIKVDVTTMVTNIIASVRALIAGAEWMEPATRQRALTKLGNMRKVVAYSEQLFNESEIERVYRNVRISEGTQYLEMVEHLVVEVLQNQFRRLVESPTWDYTMPYITLNSYYNPTFNSMSILLGMLQGVFYGRDRPTALNYGAIGVVIAHEITHGFDNQGRWFDDSGNYAEWWDPATVQRLNEKKQCLIDEYGNYSYPVNTTFSVPIDGAMTQGENIADNGGYRASLYALRNIIAAESKKRSRRRRQPKTQIRGMEIYSDEQLFFIGSALWLCSKSEERLLMTMLRDEHPPDRVRATVTLRNMDEFSHAFACPTGSPMNPVGKCRVW